MASALLLSLLTTASVGGSAAYLGSLMITRRMALVGDALGHVALPGIGLALLLGLDPSLGAFASLLVGVLLTWQLSARTVLSMETLIGIAFVSSVALGFLLVPQPELLESLIGDLSRLTTAGSLWALALSLLTSLLVKRLYPGILLANLSPDLAAVEGIRTQRANLLYLLAVALIVSVGIKVTGTLLVGALVIVPPATARILTQDLRSYARVSVATGIISGVAGVLASKFTGFPAGPSIILVSTVLFFLSFAAQSGLRKRSEPFVHTRRREGPTDDSARRQKEDSLGRRPVLQRLRTRQANR